MRARALLVALSVAALAVVVLPACGDDRPPAEAEVRATLDAFAKATAAKDEQRLCDRLLARDLVSRVERAGLPCEQALRVGLRDVRDPRLEVRSVRVRGDRAEARVRSTAAGQPASTDVVRLVREPGGWRIASLAG